MSRKTKPSAKESTARRTPSAVPPLPKLDPAEQRAALEKLIADQGSRPVEDFDEFLQQVGDAWPEEENLDEFLAWLRSLRNG